MDALVAAFLAIGLLVVIVLIVYLIDRINGIERETRRVAQSVVAAAPVNQEPFGGLSGKKLWDALCGRPPEGTSEHTLQEWRERFEVVLHKHIQSLFEEGTKDARRGLSGEPPNTRTIRTARLTVESWMPAPQANTLYKCGMYSVQLPANELAPVRAALDEAGQQLFSKVLIDLKEPLSRSLMPPEPGPAQGAGAPGLALPDQTT